MPAELCDEDKGLCLGRGIAAFDAEEGSLSQWHLGGSFALLRANEAE